MRLHGRPVLALAAGLGGVLQAAVRLGLLRQVAAVVAAAGHIERLLLQHGGGDAGDQSELEHFFCFLFGRRIESRCV